MNNLSIMDDLDPRCNLRKIRNNKKLRTIRNFKNVSYATIDPELTGSHMSPLAHILKPC